MCGWSVGVCVDGMWLHVDGMLVHVDGVCPRVGVGVLCGYAWTSMWMVHGCVDGCGWRVSTCKCVCMVCGYMCISMWMLYGSLWMVCGCMSG